MLSGVISQQQWGDASSNALRQPGNTALTGRLIGIYLVENDPEI